MKLKLLKLSTKLKLKLKFGNTVRFHHVNWVEWHCLFHSYLKTDTVLRDIF